MHGTVTVWSLVGWVMLWIFSIANLVAAYVEVAHCKGKALLFFITGISLVVVVVLLAPCNLSIK